MLLYPKSGAVYSDSVGYYLDVIFCTLSSKFSIGRSLLGLPTLSFVFGLGASLMMCEVTSISGSRSLLLLLSTCHGYVAVCDMILWEFVPGSAY